ncbi:chalcone isomerase family protein [Candidatus Berkiella aquae]|uniref:Chalcone isomerase family protein n=1 Tax=Candidatus Berkiella aquae TaxID=295108 RepID=A0A0Q9YQ21_9GAMM|nr:chalcone isomerase family protein [Candidatus Berkiella aquae]MCS5711824.1 chalcone isomerase family protein [Candidatus Berkiella aquae]
MHYLLKRFIVFVLLCCLPAISFAENKEFYGRSIPLTVVMEESNETLTLRGVALSKHFFEDDYIGAFYSQNTVLDAKAALADMGPKRMVFYFLRSNDHFREQLESAIEENNSPQMVQREQINISQLLKIFDRPLREGDIVILDYIPKVGMRIILRGTVNVVIKDTEIYNLVLKSWMGRQPPSKKFRKDLFNLT